MQCFHCVFQVTVVTRRYSTYYFPCARSVPWLLAQFYELFNTSWKCQSAVNSYINQSYWGHLVSLAVCVSAAKHGRLPVWCSSLAASDASVSLSSNMWEKSGRLTSLTRETKGNQLPPLISSSSLFLQLCPMICTWISLVDMIPERVNCVGALQWEYTWNPEGNFSRCGLFSIGPVSSAVSALGTQCKLDEVLGRVTPFPFAAVELKLFIPFLQIHVLPLPWVLSQRCRV